MEEIEKFYPIVLSGMLLSMPMRSTHKIVLSQLVALTHNMSKSCWATNEYLSEKLGLSENAVSRSINYLNKNGFIRIESEKKKVEIGIKIYTNRRIYLTETTKNLFNKEK